MSKKCILCDDEAAFAVKDTNNFYCRDCASEQFGDLSLLEPLADSRKVADSLLSKNIPQDNEGDA